MASSNPNTFPVAPPPPGEVVNLIDPGTNDQVSFQIGIVMGILVALFTAGRVYYGKCAQSKIGAENWFLLVTTATQIAFIVLAILVTRGSAHVYSTSFIDAQAAADPGSLKGRATTAASAVAALGSVTSKTSICIFYIQQFPLNRKTRIFSYITITATCIIFILVHFAILFYTRTPRPGKFSIQNNTDFAMRSQLLETWQNTMGALNVAIELCIWILPIPAIVRLKLPKKQRFGVGAILFVDLIAVAAAAASFAIQLQLSNHMADFTWTPTYTFATQIVENSITVICACLPACFFLAQHVYQRAVKKPGKGAAEPFIAESFERRDLEAR